MTMSASDSLFALTFIAWKKILWPFFTEKSFDIHHLALTFKHSNSNSYCSVTFIAPFLSKQPTIQLSSWFRHSLLPFLQITISQPNSVSDIYCSGWHLLPFCFLRLKLFVNPLNAFRSASFSEPCLFQSSKRWQPPNQSSQTISSPNLSTKNQPNDLFQKNFESPPPLRNLGNNFRNFWI